MPPAEIRETHSAVIALVGDLAYKAKKPVDLGFLDFTSLQAREAAIHQELVLNRRIAPDVYLDQAALCGSDGAVLEHVLVMRRMPDSRRLATMVEKGTVRHDDLRAIARLLADFHSTARRGADITIEAGVRGLRRRWTDNLRECERFVGTLIPRAMYQRVGELALSYVDGRTELFERRASAGLYLDGHGDVTAEDVFCLEDGPRVLDCIDFDPRLRWVDALDDAAFLAMELEHLGRPDLGRYFLDEYAEFSAVPSVASLEHHYLAYRAFVRAKVACLRAVADDLAAQQLVESYLAMTLRHLEAGQVALVLVGGAPGTGKTTVAGRLADTLGAVLISTDDVRQQLGLASYDERAKAAVYDELLSRARRALANGESVVADATWGAEAMRRAARACADQTRSRLVELECHAPRDLAAVRAQRRLETGTSASTAGAAVAHLLAEHRDPWPSASPVDTSGSPDEAMRWISVVLAFPASPAAPRPEQRQAQRRVGAVPTPAATVGSGSGG
jgi:aminoglycoside phosphotransferase family enzyme/predicted kinase